MRYAHEKQLDIQTFLWQGKEDGDNNKWTRRKKRPTLLFYGSWQKFQIYRTVQTIAAKCLVTHIFCSDLLFFITRVFLHSLAAVLSVCVCVRGYEKRGFTFKSNSEHKRTNGMCTYLIDAFDQRTVFIPSTTTVCSCLH